MTTQERALQLTDWLGNNEIHQMSPSMLLAIVKSYLMMEHVTTLKEAAELVDQCNREGPYNAIGAGSRLRALAEERSIG